ncbi:MAG TPA: aldehyde dehydrogenase family protein [Candidatus Polarisedimenticolia bacterium]|jgi:aldehyde dehydrogenase (NAD+)|nr:aldehyde dehydrogenase family protein [Candidatus Polarisedimenticolia bacterium]
MAEAKTYRNFINGEWVASSSGKVFENRNPADHSEIVGCFQDSSREDVDQAVAAAREAYRKWRLTPAPKRAEYVYKVGEILVRRKEEYAREMTREMGKILKETRGDVQEGIDISYYTAGEGRRMFGRTVPSELPNKYAMSLRMPVGICSLITPWNFPMAIPSWKLMPALVCGNTVVLKPASDTPLSAYHLVKVCQEAGIPRGVVNLVTGSGRNVGTPLLEHPHVDLVSFTGSTETGGQVGETAARLFKRCSLEMGGKNAIIVMDDARLDLALDGVLWGAFGTAGQRCTATSRVVVHKKVYDEFMEKLVERAKNLKVGDGLDETVEMGPVINEAAVKKITDYVQIGRDEGATLTCGGVRLTKAELGRGFFFSPTIFGDVNPGMRLAQEEIFGPILSVIPCDGLDQAIEIVNGVKYGLSSAIYTQDVNRAFVAMRDLFTGIFYVNSSTIGAEVQLPFGGTKQTGNGHREAADTALDIFSEWKAVYVDFSGKLQKAQIDS